MRLPACNALRAAKNVKALVTGATGFIGGALANWLLGSGWEVCVLIRPGSQERLANPERFQIVEADLSQPSKISAGASELRADVWVHAAAIRNRWGTPPEAYYAANVAATQALLAAAIGQTKRFVYLSSVGVTGRPGVLGIDEEFPIRVADTWDYHSSKAAGEKVTREYGNQLETVIVRPTITYGPGDTDGMVTRLMQMVKQKRFLRIGRGDNYVHLTYIDDLLQGIHLAMTHVQAPGNTYIFAGPEPIQMKALLAQIETLTGQQLPNWHLPQTLTRVLGMICEAAFSVLPPHWAPPITRDKVDNLCVNRGFSSHKAIQELGFHPQYSYPTGLQQTYAWLRA
jgi:nucleoside-diphosphate-sugar epimerase